MNAAYHVVIGLLVVGVTVAAGHISAVQTAEASKPVALKGVVAGLLAVPNRPVVLLLEAGTPEKPDMWAIQGDLPSALVIAGCVFPVRGGAQTPSVRNGDVVEVSVRVSAATPLAPMLSGAPPSFAEAAKSARSAKGIAVTLSNGKTLPLITSP